MTEKFEVEIQVKENHDERATLRHALNSNSDIQKATIRQNE